jgi:glycosyltransferase involved in cell wall biosynthesis
VRLLIVIPTLDPQAGGTSATAVSLARMMIDRGHEVSIWTTNPPSRARSRPTPKLVNHHGSLAGVEGVSVRFFRTRFPRRWAFCPEMGPALRAAGSDFDIAYIYSLYLHVSWQAGRRLRQGRVPYVLHVHGSLYPFLRKRGRIRKAISWWLFDRYLARNSAAIHSASEQEYTINKSLMPESLGVVIPHSIDPLAYRQLPPKGTFRSAHPELGTERLVVFVGRLAQQKGIDLLVDAFAICRRTTSDIRLVLSGPDGGALPSLRERVRHHGVADRVHFTGFIDGEHKRALLSDAAVWVCISRADNFGIAAVEALACGVPVVVSKEMGISDTVSTRGVGIVVPGSAQSAAEAILHLLADDRNHDEIARRARTTVADCYGPDIVSFQMETFFAKVIAGRVEDGATYRPHGAKMTHPPQGVPVQGRADPG